MNELDSELLHNQLRALGYRFTSDWKRADIILYNTCSVREHAEAKVYSRIGRAGKRKRDKPDLVIGVIGCMAERDGWEMIRRYPQVDILCGPGEIDKLPRLIDDTLKTSRPAVALQGSTSRRSAALSAAADRLELLDLSRGLTSTDQRAGGRSAYVRITRGCNKFCTYCVVPFTRGAEIHRPPDNIVDECQRLVDGGVIEITLLGQTVNHYRFEHDHVVSVQGIQQPQKGRSYRGGHDRDPFSGESVTTFADLLYRIHEEVPGIQRLRFLTSYPRDFGNDVLEVIRDCPRICRYLHVPVQSGSNRILDLMNRGYHVEHYREFLERVREYLPDSMVASDIIVGFSTETEGDFQATVNLLRWARFKNCFIFKYSPRPGTSAFEKMPDDVPQATKKLRNTRLLALQAEISDEIHRAQVGTTQNVFVEGISRKEARRRRGSASPHTYDNGNGDGVVAVTIAGRTRDTNGTVVADHGRAAAATAGATDSAADGSMPESDPAVQLVGRTGGDLIIVFEVAESATEALIGTVVPVKIEGNSSLTLFGRLG